MKMNVITAIVLYDDADTLPADMQHIQAKAKKCHTYIAKSTIADAGWGLFAGLEFNFLDTTDEDEKFWIPMGGVFTKAKPALNGYVIKIDGGYIDAGNLETRGPGSMANSVEDKDDRDAAIRVKDRKAYLHVETNVSPGEEIFTYYPWK